MSLPEIEREEKKWTPNIYALWPRTVVRPFIGEKHVTNSGSTRLFLAKKIAFYCLGKPELVVN